jgi:hypothetical protein
MSIGSCWGSENKKRICSEYIVTPVLHLRALAGKSKPSCAGRDVETWFYMFRAQNRETKRIENFFAGEHAANEFLRIIPAASLPRFNPLIDIMPDPEAVEDDEVGHPPNAGNHDVGQHRTALNLELFRAVRLFAYWVPEDPDAPLSGLISDIDECQSDRRNKTLVKSLNTMIKKYNSTLRSMINDLESRGYRIRYFRFPHILSAIEELGVQNYIDP